MLSQTKNYLLNVAKKPEAKAEYKSAYLLSINPKILIDGGFDLNKKVSEEKTLQKFIDDMIPGLGYIKALSVVRDALLKDAGVR